ncbi:MAG TPA: hypothetical protein VG165_11275 [Solirubrobacteraceae bacterium]|jgi:hypothetical protein|nr:hypothetical protein [Solirubrobacteraceae bacterium]
MKIYGGGVETSVETILRYGELADQGGDPQAAADAWTAARFDDDGASAWLDARCFDPESARAMADLDVTPRQAATRTRDGRGDYIDTLAFKVSKGDLSARQAAARARSSR